MHIDSNVLAFVQVVNVTFFCTGKIYEDRSYIFKVNPTIKEAVNT